MAGGASDKTERPTPRRLREARRKGNIPLGRDLTSAIAFAAGVGALVATGSRIATSTLVAVRSALDGVATARDLDAPGAFARLDAALFDVLESALPIAGCALLAGVLATALQTGGAITVSALAPKGERLDPIAGL